MFSVSSYFSIEYLVILLPISVALYAVLPQKLRRISLLLSSYAFFWAVSGKLIAYLLFSTLSTHYTGLWLSSLQEDCDRLAAATPKENRKAVRAQYRQKQRLVVAFAAALHIGLLLVLKYGPFFAGNINTALWALRIPFALEIPSYILPIGISFYTLQAMAYIFDVYRRKIPADRNLLRVALFMSFFPQIMEGPICRYSETAAQLWEAPKLQYRNLTFGLQRILFGFMKKIVVADRLNLMIKNVFSDYQNYDGFVLAVAAVGYTVQLYMDFSGTMDLVIGSGQIFGMRLPENFQRPFFSKSISEFWKRWHITLGTWFKDYVFYPLSMSAPLKKLTVRARKRLGNRFGPLASGAVALFCVWLCNGLWHGAGWNYIFFGMYHFALILAGSLIEPLAAQAAEKLHIERNSAPYRCLRIVRTAALVCVGELFFRAHGLKAGLAMFKRIFTDFSLSTVQDHSIFTFGMDRQDFLIVGVALALVFTVGVLQERNIKIRAQLAAKNVALRFAAYYALILFVVIFGAYGAGYVPVDPIYAGF